MGKDRVKERAFDEGWGLPGSEPEEKNKRMDSTVGHFNESALRAWEFARCQRPDGSTYGTSGTCRKGVEISRVETGYFVIDNQQGERVGSIMAEGSFTGGGGIRESGRSAKYTVQVGDKRRSGITLQQAKNQARDWLGEKMTVSAPKAAGKITPAKLRNMKRKLEEKEEDLLESMKGSNVKNILFLQNEVNVLRQQLQQAESSLG